jgi:thiol-disulfide isomerase/thioredoxin
MTSAVASLIFLIAGTDAIRDGAFGFPQDQAVVLCDWPDLRLSVWNNREVLFVQAVLWNDGDETPGETQDGRPIGDNAALGLDVNADSRYTANVDRIYYLNPWPSRPGLRFQVYGAGGQTTHLEHDSSGRGSITYLPTDKGRRARVDNFVIPLSELGTAPGRELRLVYFTHSPVPALRLDSAGFQPMGTYYIKQVPLNVYQSIMLADRATPIDVSVVPRGRDVVPQGNTTTVAPPAVGATPPKLDAVEWLHIDPAPTLQALRGDVVLVEFWTSSCGACIKAIPELNSLHDRYADQGLRVLALTPQSRQGVEWVMTKSPIRYAIGAGSKARFTWGVSSVPRAFLIGRDGRVLWYGRPSDGLEQRVVNALEAPSP